jgi:hypothetical protein
VDIRRVDEMCAHTLKRLAIEGCDNPSRVQSVVKKTRENNQNCWEDALNYKPNNHSKVGT